MVNTFEAGKLPCECGVPTKHCSWCSSWGEGTFFSVRTLAKAYHYSPPISTPEKKLIPQRKNVTPTSSPKTTTATKLETCSYCGCFVKEKKRLAHQNQYCQKRPRSGPPASQPTPAASIQSTQPQTAINCAVEPQRHTSTLDICCYCHRRVPSLKIESHEELCTKKPVLITIKNFTADTWPTFPPQPIVKKLPPKSQKCSAKPKPAPKFKTCTSCLQPVKEEKLLRHQAQRCSKRSINAASTSQPLPIVSTQPVPASSPQISQPNISTPAWPFAFCRYCGRMQRLKNLRTHETKSCSKRSEPTHRSLAAKERNAQQPARHGKYWRSDTAQNEGYLSPRDVLNDVRPELERLYAFGLGRNAREDGCFGSHPAFDNYGEESKP